MSVPVVNIRIDKGTNFEATFTVENSDGSAFNLLNYAATAKIKKHPGASTSTSFSTVMTVSTGEIKISLTAAQTAELSPGINTYDVIITDSNTSAITKVFEGMARVYDSVTP